MRVLGLDTAGREGGAALLVNDGVLQVSLGEGQRHAEALFTKVQGLLGSASAGYGDLTGVAVNEGPGSFTGIRIGLSAALGMSEATGVVVVGLGCLDIQAAACYSATDLEKGTYLISTADVRRGEVAWAGFEVAASGVERQSEDALGAAAAPCAPPPSGTVVTGDAAELVWPDREDLIRWVPSGPQRAAAAAVLGGQLIRSGTSRPAAPRYLRPADAKRKRR